MKLRLTRTASRQLDNVLADIALQSPSGARNVQERIRAVIQLLLRHPFAGQATGHRDIRRMVVSPYPYILTYRGGDQEIVIRTVRHGARRPLSDVRPPTAT